MFWLESFKEYVVYTKMFVTNCDISELKYLAKTNIEVFDATFRAGISLLFLLMKLFFRFACLIDFYAVEMKEFKSG